MADRAFISISAEPCNCSPRRNNSNPTKLKVGMVIKSRPQAKLADEVLTLKPGTVEIAVVPPSHPA